MKLKNKLQPLTDRQKRGAEEHCFAKYYARSRNRNYCLECGNKFMPHSTALGDAVLDVTCPGCKKKLKSMPWEGPQSMNAYWSIITTRNGFQVIRVIRTTKHVRRKKPPTYDHHEVMQHWVNRYGKVISLTIYAQGMGYYYDSWVIGTPLEPRTNSNSHAMRCGIIPDWIAPYQRTLPIIRRNGYTGETHHQPPHYLFSTILSNPFAETLLKAGQVALLKKCVDGHNDIENYWHSIKIAIRHGYMVSDATTWLDNLKMLDRLGKDAHNPKYVCTENLEADHGHHVDKVQEIREQEALERRKKQIAEENIEYQKRIAPFMDLKLTDGDLEIIPLKDVEQFLIEGQQLHHCIFASNYHQREDSLVLSARINGQPVETVEVDLKKMKVAQARGLQNQPTEHHEWIVAAVQKNMDKIAERNNYKEVAA